MLRNNHTNRKLGLEIEGHVACDAMQKFLVNVEFELTAFEDSDTNIPSAVR
jgi:hypothetical protein